MQVKLSDFLNGRQSTKDALEKHLKKAAQDSQVSTKKKHGKPEKELQKRLFSMLKKEPYKFELFVTDAGRNAHLYTSPFEQGHSDLSGDTPLGIACYIEVKAPGKIKNLSNAQYHFLERKIERGCLAFVTDSLEKTKEIIDQYMTLRRHSLDKARAYLRTRLNESAPKLVRDEIDQDLGF